MLENSGSTIYVCRYEGGGASGRTQAKLFFADWLSCDSESIALGEHSNGKPFLVGYPGINIGISHSKEILVAYIGMQNVGIDIEYLLRSLDFDLICRRCFSEAEKKLYHNNDEKKNFGFYTVWTLKEALCKLSGVGFAGLLSCQMTCSYRYWIINDQYLLCLAGSEDVFADIRLVIKNDAELAVKAFYIA